MQIAEIEAAFKPSKVVRRTPHPLEAPELHLSHTFYPLGFPVIVRTNSTGIVAQAEELWKHFELRFEIEPILIEIHMSGDPHESIDCPPAPEFKMILPLLINVADARHYSLFDLAEGRSQIVLSRASEEHKRYLSYFFIEAAALGQIAGRHATPVHAACVEWKGRGILLCGESGAGKSTLAYACARAGWKYIADDATFLVHNSKGHATERIVTGNCRLVRFRPSAAGLFPEIEGLPVTPRAAGKPSIELPTSSALNLQCIQSTTADYLVFLNRQEPAQQTLRSYSREKARESLRSVVYGTPGQLAVHYETLERLMSVDVFELCYSDLDWAIERLSRLAEEGR